MTQEKLQKLAYRFWELRTEKGIHESAEKDWEDSERLELLDMEFEELMDVVGDLVYLEEVESYVTITEQVEKLMRMSQGLHRSNPHVIRVTHRSTS